MTLDENRSSPDRMSPLIPGCEDDEDEQAGGKVPSLLLFSTDIQERLSWSDCLEPRLHCEGASDIEGARVLFSSKEVKIKLVLAEIKRDRPQELKNVIRLIQLLKTMGWFYVPIVLITHQGTDEALAQCLEKGASGYIMKPFETPTLLFDRVTSLLERFRKTQVASARCIMGRSL